MNIQLAQLRDFKFLNMKLEVIILIFEMMSFRLAVAYTILGLEKELHHKIQ